MVEEIKNNLDGVRYLIFTMPRCSNCITNKRLLKTNGIEFKEVDVATDKGMELAEYYGIKSGGEVIDVVTSKIVDVVELIVG